MATDNHTPLNTTGDDLTDRNVSQSAMPSDNVVNKRTQVQSPIKSKESEPFAIRRENSQNEAESLVEQDKLVESGESAENATTIRPDVPNIDKVAKDAGVKVAPTATKFPTVYDVKTIMPDDQIEKGLHDSPLKGARWMAEIANYILWQARIGIKKIGNRIVRYRLAGDVGILARLKRIFWY